MALRLVLLAWAFLLAVPVACQNATLPSLPPCSLSCIAEVIPVSTCDPSTNLPCICAVPDLYSSIESCPRSQCALLEGIHMLGTQRDAMRAALCNRPWRSRRLSLYLILLFVIPALLFIPLRLYSRWITMGRFEKDAYVMILGGVLYVGELFYLLTVFFAKVSIILFYLRLVPGEGFRWTAYLVMGIVIVANLVVLFLLIFQCVPIHYSSDGWREEDGASKCMNVNMLVTARAGVNIAQEGIILLLPVPVLSKLHASFRTKLNVAAMFSLGIFALVPSSLRLHFIVLFARTANVSWGSTDTFIWTGIETGICVLVPYIPAIRALLVRTWLRVFGWTASNYAGSSKSTRSGFRSAQEQRARNMNRGELVSLESRDADNAERSESQVQLKDHTPSGKVSVVTDISIVEAGVEHPESSPSDATGVWAGPRAVPDDRHFYVSR
ncbi:CFEM domain-containing protein [Lasiosphaeria ovina]|uniref:CFEM domain-containing protein n=1 Tax=Lasiosphaeria ovina TaxID=92902 RepID=A0AAE0KAJ8_9PEZI|nr:CFEM domain-containing protein [Lasiosphaeria ovina]